MVYSLQEAGVELSCFSSFAACGILPADMRRLWEDHLPLLVSLRLDQDVLLPLQHPQEDEGIQVGLWDCGNNGFRAPTQHSLMFLCRMLS